jgi:hypothetical protein
MLSRLQIATSPLLPEMLLIPILAVQANDAWLHLLLAIGKQRALVEKLWIFKGYYIKPGNRSGEMGPIIDQLALDKIERHISQAEKLRF